LHHRPASPILIFIPGGILLRWFTHRLHQARVLGMWIGVVVDGVDAHFEEPFVAVVEEVLENASPRPRIERFSAILS